MQFLNSQVLRISYGCPKTIYESLPKCISTLNFCSLCSHPNPSYIVTSSSGKGKRRNKLDCSKIHKVYKRQRNRIQKTHSCLVQICKGLGTHQHLNEASQKKRSSAICCFHTLVLVGNITFMSIINYQVYHTHINFIFFPNYIN